MKPLALDPLPGPPTAPESGPRHAPFWHPSPVPAPQSAQLDFASPCLPAWPQQHRPDPTPPSPASPPQPRPASGNERTPTTPPCPAGDHPAPLPLSVEPPDFSDADLRAALLPVLGPGLPSLASLDEEQLIARLEPLLRAAVRRALAEADAASRRPFRAPGLWDRLRWGLTALLTSRTYDEVLFEKTRRFRVEEVFLLDPGTLAMISYASDDPARHAQPQCVQGTARRLARHAKAPDGSLTASFSLPEQRTAHTIAGRNALLVAVTRGSANDLLLTDLTFCLSRIEVRFRDRLRTPGAPLLAELQPFLEDCLLIRSPPAA